MLASCGKNTPSGEQAEREQSTFCEVIERVGGPIWIYKTDSVQEADHKLRLIAAYSCGCLKDCPKK